ncbi:MULTISPECIES: keywimysin-related RiPP [Streptomyces]|nr:MULTISPECIES: keywimysin-related RiPP [Streptomyces]MBC2874619.1 putative RiPP precursor [Streptomyces sp. TYQ1024]UBI36616.1 putative RiPP precursor [Streptomyces mobaraensis]UKW29208.1 keywimysin-related RiPP [Streptomyces sp. TYQ1024]
MKKNYMKPTLFKQGDFTKKTAGWFMSKKSETLTWRIGGS